MASPPFNPSESTPADGSLASVFPAAERLFRDIIESWLLFEHGRSGHHTFSVVDTSTRDADTTWEVGSLVYNTDDEELQVLTDDSPVTWVSVTRFNTGDPEDDFDLIKVAGSDTYAGVWEKGTVGEVASAASNKVLTTDHMETANAYGTLTDAATIAVDWDTALGWECTPSTNRILGNPTNGQPNTVRNVLLNPASGGNRTVTFGNQYLGTLPVISDLSSTVWYLLTIYCISSTHFSVSAKKVKG